MIFYTRSCAHIADTIDLPRGNTRVELCKDGELMLKIDTNVNGKQVWVCASTVAPAENILETLFLIDALKRAGAIVKVLFIYFGYARQDRLLSGEPLSVEVLGNCLQQFQCKELHVVHMHNPTVCSSLPLYSHIPYAFFDQAVRDIDLLVAPDAGAAGLAKQLAKRHNKAYGVVTKIRKSNDQVEIMKLDIDVSGKNILIVDDMISTGSTVLQVSEVLRERGAQRISVAATHGLFSSDALINIERSSIERVFVTNTLVQHLRCSKVSIVDISFFMRTLFI